MYKFFTLSNILLFLAPMVANAQYTPLAPLSSNAKELTSLGGYLSDLFLLGIGLAGVLAVIMLVVAGIQFIGGASSESQRKDAKERIWAAILGLLIALGSWMLLNTIDNNLVAVPDASLQPTTIDISPTGEGATQSGPVGSTVTGPAGPSSITTTEYCYTPKKSVGNNRLKRPVCDSTCTAPTGQTCTTQTKLTAAKYCYDKRITRGGGSTKEQCPTTCPAGKTCTIKQ